MSRLTLQQEALNCSDTSRLTEIYWSSVKKRDLSEKIAIQKAIATNTRTSIETLKECFKSSELVRLVIRNDAFREHLENNKELYRRWDILSAICSYGSGLLIATALKEVKYTDINTGFIWSIINNELYQKTWNEDNVTFIIQKLSDLIDEGLKYNDNNIMRNLIPDLLKKNLLDHYRNALYSKQLIIMLCNKVREYVNNNIAA